MTRNAVCSWSELSAIFVRFNFIHLKIYFIPFQIKRVLITVLVCTRTNRSYKTVWAMVTPKSINYFASYSRYVCFLYNSKLMQKANANITYQFLFLNKHFWNHIFSSNSVNILRENDATTFLCKNRMTFISFCTFECKIVPTNIIICCRIEQH